MFAVRKCSRSEKPNNSTVGFSECITGAEAIGSSVFVPAVFRAPVSAGAVEPDDIEKAAAMDRPAPVCSFSRIRHPAAGRKEEVPRGGNSCDRFSYFPMQKREKISSRMSGVAVSPVMQPISSAAVRSELPASSHDPCFAHSAAVPRWFAACSSSAA